MKLNQILQKRNFRRVIEQVNKEEKKAEIKNENLREVW